MFKVNEVYYMNSMKSGSFEESYAFVVKRTDDYASRIVIITGKNKGEERSILNGNILQNGERWDNYNLPIGSRVKLIVDDNKANGLECTIIDKTSNENGYISYNVEFVNGALVTYPRHELLIKLRYIIRRPQYDESASASGTFYKNEAEGLRIDLIAAKEQISNLQKLVDKNNGFNNVLLHENESMKKRIEFLESSELTTVIESLTKSNDCLMKRVQNLDDAKQGMLATIQSLSETNAYLKSRITDLEKKLEDSENQVKWFNNDITRLTECISYLIKARNFAEEENQRIRNKYYNLKTQPN